MLSQSAELLSNGTFKYQPEAFAMSNEIELRVTDFSKTPGGRHKTDGPANGQTYRQHHLVPALKSGKKVRVILDGTRGYGSSFLDEAFGGLVRDEGYTAAWLRSWLELEAKGRAYVFYRDRAWAYIDGAKPRVDGALPA